MSKPFKIQIPPAELVCQYSRASGPGGQNVNKVETRCQLFFDIQNSSILSDYTKIRLLKIDKNQINSEGRLIICSQDYRSQERNRHACIKKLKHLIEIARHKPKTRKKTKPSRSAIEKRLTNKKHKGTIKKLRRGYTE